MLSIWLQDLKRKRSRAWRSVWVFSSQRGNLLHIVSYICAAGCCFVVIVFLFLSLISCLIIDLLFITAAVVVDVSQCV